MELALSLAAAVCSTPRGITGKIADIAQTGAEGLQTCSTPRGITGKIARARDLRYCAACGAQRLAASPEKSPTHWYRYPNCALRAQRLAASPEKSQARLPRAVRNTSRSANSAQRLAASPEKSHSDAGLMSAPPSSAQRLAASPEKSRVGWRRTRRAAPVLNASRHHRKNR